MIRTVATAIHGEGDERGRLSHLARVGFAA
jgi:hypothetical protein